MTTLVIREDGTAICVVHSEREKNSALGQATKAGLMWCASSRIPDPQNPTVFLKQYRMHFRRKRP